MAKPTLEAKVRDHYNMGPVIAFSGHEYIRNEWRDVPVGYEAAAIAHPLLETREKETGKEIHITSQDQLAAWQAEAAVTTVTDETQPAEVTSPAEETVTTVTDPAEPEEEEAPAEEPKKTGTRHNRRTKKSEE